METVFLIVRLVTADGEIFADRYHIDKGYLSYSACLDFKLKLERRHAPVWNDSRCLIVEV